MDLTQAKAGQLPNSFKNMKVIVTVLPEELSKYKGPQAMMATDYKSRAWAVFALTCSTSKALVTLGSPEPT